MNEAEILRAVRNKERLSLLQKLELLDSSPEEAFDRLTRLAGKFTNSPVSLVSLIDADRQYFKSIFGDLPESVMKGRETPLSYSFCKHVVATGQPLIVEDARNDNVLKSNLATTELGVVGYLGIPLNAPTGENLGSLCVLDTQPHAWTEDDITTMRELADSAMSEIEHRLEIKVREDTESQLVQRNRQYRRVYHFASLTIDHMQEALNRGAEHEELLAYLEQMEKELSRL